jgi:hypoxanthine phosphoribosyltransferase
MTHLDHSGSVAKEDLHQLSYGEFGELLDVLVQHVRTVCQEQGIRIDAVAPILRSGAFPGCHLASKLGVTDILTLQYKHTYDPSQPVRSYRDPIIPHCLAADATILLADTNTVTGEIARRAVADIRAVLPECRIVFASVMLDISVETLAGIDFLIYARRTNERRTLSREEARRVGTSDEVYIFPWEDLEEQWNEIQAAQS